MRLCTAVILSVFFFSKAYAQDLFDYPHSIKFVRYLLESGDRASAFNELLRMDARFSQPASDTVDMLLLKTGMLIGKKAEVFQRIRSRAADRNMAPAVHDLSIAICLLEDSLPLSDLLFSSRTGGTRDLLIGYRILSKQYEAAAKLLADSAASVSDREFYSGLLALQRGWKKKSKGLAVLMSVAVPASGKYYLKQPVDATAGLAYCAIYGFLSIHAYRQVGSASIFGAVNAAAFCLFYIGNIWGTARAADRYNNKINLTIRHDIREKLRPLVSL